MGQNGDAVVGAAHPEPGSDITWTILPKCRIAEGVAVDLVAMHARAGVAILEIGPHWTPEAVPLLRATLAASGFDAACPGNLPVIHRRLRPEDVPLLRDLLAESFLWQPPLTLAEDSDWIARLRGALAGLGEAGPAVEAPGPEPRAAGRPADEPTPFDDPPIRRADPPTGLAFPAGAPANGPARSPMAAPASVATPAAAPVAAGGRSRAVILALAGIGALGALALAQQDLLPGQAVREGHGVGRGRRRGGDGGLAPGAAGSARGAARAGGDRQARRRPSAVGFRIRDDCGGGADGPAGHCTWVRRWSAAGAAGSRGGGAGRHGGRNDGRHANGH